MTPKFIKLLKFLFSREREIAPGIFHLGGDVYENRNPTKEPPIKRMDIPMKLFRIVFDPGIPILILARNKKEAIRQARYTFFHSVLYHKIHTLK
jgi:hypothetical protein